MLDLDLNKAQASQPILIDWYKYKVDFDKLRTYSGREGFCKWTNTSKQRFFSRKIHDLQVITDEDYEESGEITLRGKVKFLGRTFIVEAYSCMGENGFFAHLDDDFGFEVVGEE